MGGDEDENIKDDSVRREVKVNTDVFEDVSASSVVCAIRAGVRGSGV
jgi:hypothetical protein